MISPMIEELAMSFAGQAKVGKLNIDNYVRVQRNIASSCPHCCFSNRVRLSIRLGVVPKQVLVDKLNALFESDATLEPAA